jgi:hypothetical protein
MAAPTGTFISTAAVGNRESLHDIISILYKDEFPFQSAIDQGTAEATYEEWQTDDLGSASTTNFQPEGNTFVAAAIVPTVRVGNRLQILSKPFSVSATQEAVKKAGRDSEVSYQSALAGRRLKMDIEATISQNQASASTDPRKMGGYETWITSNTSRGAGGTNGGFSGGNTTAPGAGTPRAFTEALLKATIKACYDNGGKPNLLIMSSGQKQIFSTFTGIATQYQEPKGKMATIVSASDRYVSDFGTFTAMPSRYVRAGSVLVVDPDLWRVLYLRRIRREEMAKVSDAKAYQLICEATLESKNEKGSGVVADLS